MKTAGKVSTIPYVLEKRKGRKSISVRVQADGTVRISAPYSVSHAAVEKLLLDNQEKILRAVADAKQNLHTYTSGETFLFAGVAYVLEVRQGTESSVQLSSDSMVVTLASQKGAPADVQALVKAYFRAALKERLLPMVVHWASVVGVPVPPLTIRDTNSRWGSCSSKGRLSFSLRSQILSDQQLSYLVLHEIAHLVYFNHSSKFHDLVEHHIPGHRKIQASIFALQKRSRLSF